MASILPYKEKFRVHIEIEGIRKSKVLPTIKKAKSWAAEEETKIRKEAKIRRTRDEILDDSYTLVKLSKKYSEEISADKKGARWEIIRLTFYQRAFPKFYAIKLMNLERENIEEWMESRLNPDPKTKVKPVKASTINRDLNLISHCLTQARRWRLMSHKPFEDLKRPRNPEHRKRRISDDEIEQMCGALKYKEGVVLKQKQQRACLAWLFAIETCMRCSEITGITEQTLDRVRGIAHLLDTKNGSSQDVPLSPRALKLLEQLPKAPNKKTPLFQVASTSVDALFRKARDKKTRIKDLHFHDSRHEGITRLVDTKKYNVFEVASITGHKDINELLTYYNKSAAQIAQEMAQESATRTTSVMEGLTSIPDIGQVAGLKDLVAQVLIEQARLSA